MRSQQATLPHEILFPQSYGVHSGEPSQLYLKPAPVNHGIVFYWKDKNGSTHKIKAASEGLYSSRFFTSLGSKRGYIATIEHLMAALYVFNIDNVVIEVSSPEIPIFDGSAKVFVDAFQHGGISLQPQPKEYMRIKEVVRVENGDSFAEFFPYEGFLFDVRIDFSSKTIGKQRLLLDVTEESFAQEIAPASTFGFMKDLEKMQRAELARGANLANTIVVGLQDEVLNQEKLLWQDVFVRHKTLDAIGDVALLGRKFVGGFRSYRGGHMLNTKLVQALMNTARSYEIFLAT